MGKKLTQSLYGVAGLALMAGSIGIGVVTRERWQPIGDRISLGTMLTTTDSGTHPAVVAGESGGHRHGQDVAKGVSLTERARQNLGLKTGKVQLQDWWQSISIPAEVIEEPGHSEQGVSSTVQGIVLKIHAFPGQTVRAGDPLIDIQPTSELLATAESSLLKILQEMQLVELQIERMAPTIESGATPIARKLEKEYELTRLESQRLAQIQELLVAV